MLPPQKAQVPNEPAAARQAMSRCACLVHGARMRGMPLCASAAPGWSTHTDRFSSLMNYNSVNGGKKGERTPAFTQETMASSAHIASAMADVRWQTSPRPGTNISFRWQVSSLQSCSRLCMLQPCRQLPPLLQQMPNHLVLHLQQSHKRSIGIWDALLLCGRH